MLVFLYEQYHYSPKALCELRMLGEELEEKVLKPTTMKGSRWVLYIFKASKVHIVLPVSREICIHVALNPNRLCDLESLFGMPKSCLSLIVNETSWPAVVYPLSPDKSRCYDRTLCKTMMIPSMRRMRPSEKLFRFHRWHSEAYIHV